MAVMIEIPRWVHRAGDSMLVDTLEELQIAESEGWRVNPNEPDVLWTEQPEPVFVTAATWKAPGESERVSTGAVESALSEQTEVPGEAENAPEEASGEEPAAPVKRGPGRPRRNG